MSLSAHKMYGPKGVGALYVRKGRRPRLRLKPQAEGGGQERGVRSGTLNVPGHRRLRGGAPAGAGARSPAASRARLRALRDRLLAGLRARLDGIDVNGALEPRLPGNLHVSIAGVEAETLILSLGGTDRALVRRGVRRGRGKGSHVLRALGPAGRARLHGLALRSGPV